MDAMLILAILIGAVLVGGYLWYATLISRRNKAQEALSSIDVQLRKRHDLLPNVLAIAKKFMEHEKDLLTELTALRASLGSGLNAADPDGVAEALKLDGILRGAMGRFFAVAENYPELRSSENMLAAQHSFEEVEGHIAAARRFYNASVTALNNAAQIWPGSMIASMAGVRPLPFYEVEDAARAPVNAAKHLS